MSLFSDIEDVFGGNGGSQSQGVATTAGAGDGGKGTAITNLLSDITGAYDAVTGSGRPAGPAPAPQVAKPAPNYLLYGGLALLVGIGLWLLLKKH